MSREDGTDIAPIPWRSTAEQGPRESPSWVPRCWTGLGVLRRRRGSTADTGDPALCTTSVPSESSGFLEPHYGEQKDLLLKSSEGNLFSSSGWRVGEVGSTHGESGRDVDLYPTQEVTHKGNKLVRSGRADPISEGSQKRTGLEVSHRRLVRRTKDEKGLCHEEGRK